MIRGTCWAHNVVAHPMVTARALPDSPVPPKLLMFNLLMIHWTVLAQNVVAHPMAIARALPDDPFTFVC
eukprot:2410663-Heterocapsa_arctica.AAC.1